MPLVVIETNRELKNKMTGIDLYVSDYQEIPHRSEKSTYLYHVIVITNLFYYKEKKHKEGDVVQFMISKSFEEFKDLYEQLYERFPSVNFPTLPPQSLISVDYQAQLDCMNEVLKIVASAQKLCSSPMVIKFLKGQSIARKPLFAYEESSDEDEDEPIKETPSPEQTQNSEIVEEDFIDAAVEETVESSIPEDSFFSEDANGIEKAEDTAAKDENEYDSDDFDDLLSVRKDVDDIFTLIKTSNKQSLTKTTRQTSINRRNSQSKTDALTENGEDIFQRAKNSSIKRNKNDSKDLNDIFKSKPSSLFEPDADDDLFKTNISAYIKQEEETNINKMENLDLT